MLKDSAIQAAKLKLYREVVELKSEYEHYRKYPVLHPMYAKEWQIFYLRRLGDLLAGKFHY